MSTIPVIAKIAIAVALFGGLFLAINSNMESGQAATTTPPVELGNCEVSVSMRSSVDGTVSETWVLEQFHSVFVYDDAAEDDFDPTCDGKCKRVPGQCVFWHVDDHYWFLKPCVKTTCTWTCRYFG